MLFFSGVVLMAIAIANCYLCLSNNFNLDIVLLPSLWQDFISPYFHWSLWTLSKPRYLFPDIPTYFTLTWILGGNILLSLFIQILAHVVIIGSFGLWLLQKVIKVARPASWFIVGTLLALLTHQQLVAYGASQALFWPTLHAGGVAMMLAGWVLFYHYQSPARSGTLVGLLAIAFINGFSDPLTALIFTIATVGVLPLRSQLGDWRSRTGLAVGIVLCVVAGNALANSLVPFLPDQEAFARVATGGDLWQAIGKITRDLAVSPLAYPIMAAMFAMAIIGSIIILRRQKTLPWWGISGLLAAVLPIGFTILNASYSDFGTWRYFPLLLPVAGLVGMVGLHSGKVGRWAVVAFAIVVAAGSVWSWKDLKSPQHFARPDYIKNLETLHDRLDLHDGFATDWRAKPISLRSRLNFSAINAAFMPRIWLNSMNEYGLPGLPGAPKNHDYILTYLLSEPHLLQRLGPPDERHAITLDNNIHCELWVYRKPGYLDSILWNDDLFKIVLAYRLHKTPYLFTPPTRHAAYEFVRPLFEERR